MRKSSNNTYPDKQKITRKFVFGKSFKNRYLNCKNTDLIELYLTRTSTKFSKKPAVL